MFLDVSSSWMLRKFYVFSLIQRRLSKKIWFHSISTLKSRQEVFSKREFLFIQSIWSQWKNFLRQFCVPCYRDQTEKVNIKRNRYNPIFAPFNGTKYYMYIQYYWWNRCAALLHSWILVGLAYWFLATFLWFFRKRTFFWCFPIISVLIKKIRRMFKWGMWTLPHLWMRLLQSPWFWEPTL